MCPAASRLFRRRVGLAQALTNAVVHGCQGNPAGRVHVALRMKGNRLLIAVQDDGKGFDWRNKRNREADLASSSGRGMEIFRRYATHVRFNDTGNGIAILMDFDEGV